MYRNYCSKYIIRCRCGKGEPAGKVKASKAIGREANKTVLQRHVGVASSASQETVARPYLTAVVPFIPDPARVRVHLSPGSAEQPTATSYLTKNLKNKN